jgi:hypothetical protein
MAHLMYWPASWTSGEGGDLEPNEVHSWVTWGFPNAAAVSITAHPVTHSGDPNPRDLVLQVENIQGEADEIEGGRRIYFNVRNVGTGPIVGYTMAFAFVSE